MMYANKILLLLLLAGVSDAFAREYVSHQYSQGLLEIKTSDIPLSIRFLSNNTVEVHYQPEGHQQLPSYSLSSNVRAKKVKIKETSNELVVQSEILQATIQKKPFLISFENQSELLLSEKRGFFFSESAKGRKVGFSFELDSNEKLLGAGERVLGMDRRGYRLPLDNKAHYGYSTYSEQMYFSLPAVMSSKKYLLLFDNTAKGYIDLGKTEKDHLQFEAVSGRTSYIFMARDSYPKLINEYVNITGRQPMPPRWALGNFASRFGYHTETEAREMVSRFEKEDFPLDAIILDLYWFGKDIKGHLGNLAWDRKAFPTPKKMIGDFKAKGVNTILITEPFMLSTANRWDEAVEKNILAKNSEGSPQRFDFYFGNSGLIDVFNPKAQNWLWEIYQNIAGDGAVGVWGDLGEPEAHPDDSLHTLNNGMTVRGDALHNTFGHQWAEMVFTRHEQQYPKQRPFIMMRSGFAGSQRYGMIPWTGDVDRSWNGLKPQVELSLQMGLFGLGYTHSDLGGFAGGETFNKEMYIRWLQYGVFQPIYRPHGQEHIAPEPVMHDEETKNILRRYVKLRYQLLPYNYTLAFENASTGMPLMRPLFFSDENNQQLIDRKDSYMWGDAFFVAPVVSPGVENVQVTLPKGIWFDFWNKKKYLGGGKVKIPTTLDTLPVLVKAGAFIPMVDPVSTTQDYSSHQLKLHYYADASVSNASGYMYEDDGKTHRALEKAHYEILNFSAKQDQANLLISLSRDENKGYEGMPATRQLDLVIHNWQKAPAEIEFAREELAEVTSADQLNAGSYYYNAESSVLSISINWNHSRQYVNIFKKSFDIRK